MHLGWWSSKLLVMYFYGRLGAVVSLKGIPITLTCIITDKLFWLFVNTFLIIKYVLYILTAIDELYFSNRKLFSTYDNDNDSMPANCAKFCGGGWWYDNSDFVSCYCNINSKYQHNSNLPDGVGLHWNSWRPNYSLKKTEIRLYYWYRMMRCLKIRKICGCYINWTVVDGWNCVTIIMYANNFLQ